MVGTRFRDSEDGADRFSRGVDCAVLVLALLAAAFTSGVPRLLALTGFGLALLLLALRSGGGLVAAARRSRPAVRGLLAGLVVLACGALAFWSFPRKPETVPFALPELEHLPVDTRACLQQPAVEAYLRVLHEALIDEWLGLSDRQEPVARVVLEFTLLPSGVVSSPVVLASPTRALGRAALDALNQVSPFPPLGSELACLHGAPVRLALSGAGG